MALDFPNSPTAGQLYAAPNGVTYQWSSTYTAWLPLSVTSAGVGDVAAFNGTFSNVAGTANVCTNYTVLSGNSGGWMNATTGRFTPPAGRYYILCSASIQAPAASNGTASIGLRKNGTGIGATNNGSGSAQFAIPLAVGNTVDANGSDYFEAYVNPVVGSMNTQGNAAFVAFPISAAGPATGTGSSWRRIARIVPVAGQANIDFINIPADINDLELRFDVAPAVADFLVMRMFDNTGVIDAAAHYSFETKYAYHTMAAGTASTVYPGTGLSAIFLALNSSGSQVSVTDIIQGRLSINNIKDSTRRKYCEFASSYIEMSNNYYYGLHGHGQRQVTGAITGLRLLWWNGNNFAAGGMVSLYGSP